MKISPLASRLRILLVGSVLASGTAAGQGSGSERASRIVEGRGDALPEEHFDYLFRAHRELGDLGEAGGVLEAWQQAFPESGQLAQAMALYALSIGRSELEKGNDARAEEQFRYALASGAGRDEVEAELATLIEEVLAARAGSEAASALPLIPLADRLLPGHPRVLLAGATLLDGLGDSAGARARYVTYLTANPSDATIRARLQELSTGARPEGTDRPPEAAEEESAQPAAVEEGVPSRAKRALARGDLDGAEKLVSRALAGDPGGREVELAALMSRIHRARNRHAQARELIAGFGEGDALDVELVYEKAQVDVALGDPARAVADLQGLLARQDIDQATWLEGMVHLGGVLLATRDLEAAESVFLEALKIDPHLPGAHYYLGRIHENRKNLGTAVAYYERAALAPRSEDRRPEFLLRLALAYKLVGRPPDEGRVLKMLATEEPYSFQGRKARQMLRTALPGAPVTAVTLADGQAALAAGAPDLAEKAFRSSLVKGGDQAVGARIGLARVALAKHDFSGAVEELGTLPIEVRRQGEVLALMGEALYCLGDWAGASEALGLVRKRGREGARMLFWTARCLELMGQNEAALLLFEEVAHLEPSSVAARAAADGLASVESRILEAGGPGEIPRDLPALNPVTEVTEEAGLLPAPRPPRPSRAPRAPRAPAVEPEHPAGASDRTGEAVAGAIAPAAAPEPEPPPVDVPAPGAEQHLALARSAFQSGDHESSVTHFRRAMSLEPERAETYFLLADVLHAMKRYPEEKEVLEDLAGRNLGEKTTQQATLLLNRVKGR